MSTSERAGRPCACVLTCQLAKRPRFCISCGPVGRPADDDIEVGSDDGADSLHVSDSASDQLLAQEEEEGEGQEGALDGEDEDEG